MDIKNLALTFLNNWGYVLLTFVAFFVIQGRLKLGIYKARMSEQRKVVSRQMALAISWLVFIIILIVLLPLSENMKGQLISFIGILITAAVALSSTSFLGNAMAGLMLRGNDTLIPGTFIKVNGFQGRVSELGLLHTEIQTEESDLVTFSNLYLIQNPFQAINENKGTYISTEVTLGYDIAVADIRKAMLEALEKTGLTNGFVSIRSLGDFSVCYRASGQLDDVRNLISKKSQLNEKVLTTLHAHGIEIVSPNFMNQRVYKPTDIFIPRREKEEEVDISTVEEQIFEKANQAEDKENLKEDLTKVRTELDTLAEELKSADEKFKKYIQYRIDTLNKKKDLLKKKIE